MGGHCSASKLEKWQIDFKYLAKFFFNHNMLNCIRLTCTK